MSLCAECRYKHEIIDNENISSGYDCHCPNYFGAPDNIQDGEMLSCEFFVPNWITTERELLESKKGN